MSVSQGATEVSLSLVRSLDPLCAVTACVLEFLRVPLLVLSLGFFHQETLLLAG